MENSNMVVQTRYIFLSSAVRCSDQEEKTSAMPLLMNLGRITRQTISTPSIHGLWTDVSLFKSECFSKFTPR